MKKYTRDTGVAKIEKLQTKALKYKQKLRAIEDRIDEIQKQLQTIENEEYNEIHKLGHSYRRLGLARSSCGYCDDKNGGGNLIDSNRLFSRGFLGLFMDVDEFKSLGGPDINWREKDKIAAHKQDWIQFIATKLTLDQSIGYMAQAKQWISEIGTKTEKTFPGYIHGIEKYCTEDIDLPQYKGVNRVIRGTLEPLYEMRWPDQDELFGLLLLHGKDGFRLGLPYRNHGHGN